jgi:hypothetical protein
MQTKLVLKPGQHGTMKWVEKYGDKLVNVRYRYDAANRKRYKTVEIIVDETTWLPKEIIPNTSRSPSDRVGIQVAGYEKAIRQRVKQAGGIWRPRQKLWELSYGQAIALGLENRIINDNKPRK